MSQAKTKYTPKPGDSVKATLGDSVLYGTVVIPHDRPEEVYIAPEDTIQTISIDGWQIEPWVKPVNFKPLTVVRLEPDAAFSTWYDDDPEDIEPFVKPLFAYRNVEDIWTTIWDDNWFEFGDKGIQLALAAGHASILFEGVDE